jgi:hypothetical protein
LSSRISTRVLRFASVAARYASVTSDNCFGRPPGFPLSPSETSPFSDRSLISAGHSAATIASVIQSECIAKSCRAHRSKQHTQIIIALLVDALIGHAP